MDILSDDLLQITLLSDGHNMVCFHSTWLHKMYSLNVYLTRVNQYLLILQYLQYLQRFAFTMNCFQIQDCSSYVMLFSVCIAVMMKRAMTVIHHF